MRSSLAKDKYNFKIPRLLSQTPPFLVGQASSLVYKGQTRTSDLPFSKRELKGVVKNPENLPN